jgi:hypothetical protein
MARNPNKSVAGMTGGGAIQEGEIEDDVRVS